MNLSYLSFYTQYLKSPITIFHKIKINYKIYTIYTFLSIIPYFSYHYVIFFYLFITYIYFFLIRKNKNINNIIFTKQNFLYIVIFIYYIYSLHYTEKNLLNYIKYIWVKIPVFININTIIQISFLQYNIPIIIVKIFFLNLFYIQSIQILALSTKYELIILKFKNLFDTTFLSKNKKKYHFSLIIFFTSRFLEKIISNIYILYLSMKIKYSHFISSNNSFYIICILFYKYILYIHNDIIILAYNLWNKKIIMKFFIYQ